MDDECGPIGGTLGRGDQGTRIQPAQVAFVRHKTHKT
jgi:hypothetical protein